MRGTTAVGAVLIAAALPAAASGHAERPGYWPDPAPDTSISPAAGGAVPTARSLRSALPRVRRAQRERDRGSRRSAPVFAGGFERNHSYRARSGGGRVRVVCQSDSLRLARAAIARARANGYRDRPSAPLKTMSARHAKRLRRYNKLFFGACGFREIQPAVTASRNNGRVVVMPGLYTEPTSRSAPTPDPACEQYHTKGDRPGENEALSYEYQTRCPNDQNLIAVIGRALGEGEEPDPPRHNRHGIPNLGPCIRCNVQMEGSGVTADDVVIEAGDPAAGNGGPSGVGAKKDVGVRADRADGFVLRRVTVRHAGEHGIYVIETDGYLLDRFKAFYNKLYGTLTFVPDHGVQQNCEAVGHGDSGIYPGAAVESGAQRPEGTPFRYNQQVRRCDMHHNLAGWSGTNGNAVHTHRNNIYDNALGIQTDVVTGAGHPGYPGDSALFERNNIYSNNFNPYAPGSDVKPAFPFPVGTGMWIAGGNRHIVRENFFFDNWRRGTMLFSVPDSLICGPQTGNSQAGCDPNSVSTSHYNSQYANNMGVTPDGAPDANGLDFWWDAFAGSRGNCWWGNNDPNGINTSPPLLPDCADGQNPDSSIGPGGPNELELIRCFASFETRTYDQGGACPWFTPPEEPPNDSSGHSPVTTLARPSFPGPCEGEAVISSCRGDGDVRASGLRAAKRNPVPIGQLTCQDWNGADADTQWWMTRRVRGFAGGVVVSGEDALGSGAVLSDDDARLMYESWCGRRYARDFLLLKLYTHAAAFAGRR